MSAQPNGIDVDREATSLAKLATISPPTSSGPVIAIDLDGTVVHSYGPLTYVYLILFVVIFHDYLYGGNLNKDVLSQTNNTIAEWYNENYPGAKMDPSNFYYYYYWKNPYWGTPEETFKKVNIFYRSSRIHTAHPVPGAREGVQALRDMGYRLIIVTARMRTTHKDSWEWVDRHFPGVSWAQELPAPSLEPLIQTPDTSLFDSVICTGQFEDMTAKSGHELVTKLTKQEVCLDLGAKLLIDDSLENALLCISHNPPTPVLLFGDYEWNKRQSFPTDHRDDMTFSRRLATEGPAFWKNDDLEVNYPEGAPLWRVRDWGEAVRWLEKARTDGRI